MREQLRLLVAERDRIKAESDAVVIVHLKHEKNLHQVALEREKRHKKLETQRIEKGYKKLRGATRTKPFEKVAPANTNTPHKKDSHSRDLDRIRVEDIEEESKEEIGESSSKLDPRHIEDVE